jgi:hypothetical protein
MGIPIRDPQGALHVVFVRGRTLVAQQLDSTLAPVGDTVVLAERVSLGLTIRRGAYSASPSTLVYRVDAGFAPTRLQWFDRAGRALQTIDSGDAFIGGLALSPDETTVAFGRYNRDTNAFALWFADRARGTTRMVAAPAFSLEPETWSPDGRSIAGASNQSGTYRPTLMSPSGQVSALDVSVSGGFRTGDWSADGRHLLGVEDNAIWAVPVDGSGPRQRLAAGRYPKLSPDGRWLAYSSTDTGSSEVYIQRFPDGSAKTRVSTAGGIDPKWRGDGRELFYLDASGNVTAVGIRTTPSLDLGTPELLFKAQVRPDVDSNYVVTRDGQRFLLNLPNTAPAPLVAVVNWLGHRAGAR